MPIEPATTISGTNGFVATNPTDNDALQQGAQQIRLVKSVLTTTFPNVQAPITATDAQLNAAAGALVNNQLTIPTVAGNPGSVLLKAPSGKDVLLYGSSGTLQVRAQNTDGTTGLVNTFSVDGAGNAAAALTIGAPSVLQGGYLLVPHGIVCMWSGTVGSVPGGWALCDGTNGTPDLRERFILGAGTRAAGGTGGQFSYTASTDTQGAHSHGGATGLAGSTTLFGTTDSQGAHSHSGNTAGHQLTIAEMPSHSHLLEYGFGSGGASIFVTPNAGTGTGPAGGADSTGGNGSHSHGIVMDGAHAHNVAIPVGDHQHSIATDGSHAHGVVVNSTPPFYALAFIMKT
jgi:hypothetical protein